MLKFYLLMSPCLVLGIDCRLWRTRHGRCTRRGTTHSSWTCSRDSTSLSSPVPSVARWDQGIPTLPGDYLSCLGFFSYRNSLPILGIPYPPWESLPFRGTPPTVSRNSLPSLGIPYPVCECPTLFGNSLPSVVEGLFIVSMKSKNM